MGRYTADERRAAEGRSSKGIAAAQEREGRREEAVHAAAGGVERRDWIALERAQKERDALTERSKILQRQRA